MNNPQTLVIICVIFVFVGLFSIFTGRKRVQQAQARGENTRWYSQINVLLGIEYILISLVFLTSISSKMFPGSLNGVIVPIFLFLLAASLIFAGFVIRQAILNARRPRQVTSSQLPSRSANGSNKGTASETTPQQRALQLEHRRERRQKAAAARHRRTGRT